MKPQDWDNLTDDEQREQATQLLNTQRGTYLLAQALHYGIKSLNAVEPPVFRELSNIQDMEMLSLLFEPFFSIFAKPMLSVADLIEQSNADKQ